MTTTNSTITITIRRGHQTFIRSKPVTIDDRLTGEVLRAAQDHGMETVLHMIQNRGVTFSKK